MKKLYCIPSLSDIDNFIEFSIKYNAAFEYNDFFVPSILDDSISLDRITAKYMAISRDRSEDTLHGAFLDICINSQDKEIYNVSNMRVHQCMDIARTLGLKAVVFHTNYIVNFRLQSYIQNWLDRNEEYWRGIIAEYPQQMIYLENMFDDSPELLTKLAKRMEDEPHFAVCLDVAHALISGKPVEQWYKNLTTYVKHIHINDNDGAQDLHMPVGYGSFKWESYNNWCQTLSYRPSTLIEVRTYEQLIKSVEYMQQHNIYPFPLA